VVGDGGLGEVEEGDQLADADFAGVFAEDVDQLEADGVAQGLGYCRHPLGLESVDIGIDDGLAAGLAG
jgi:hypothetical protein